jgi:PadR family transcriptional regulator PadR
LAAEAKIDARPRKWLTPVALVILREESSYGYELMERVTEFGFEEISAGTLYRTLRQMEGEGLCTSEWEAAQSGPARRMYSITQEGVAYLDAWAVACKQYQRLLGSFAQAYTSNKSLRTTSSEHDEPSS